MTRLPERFPACRAILTPPGCSCRCRRWARIFEQGIDAALVAGAAGLDALAEPGFLDRQFLVEEPVLALFLGQAFLLALQKGRVIARPVQQPAAVDLDDPAGQFLHQQTVVGDDDDGAAVGGQKVLQPGDGVDIQVIGGLVEHEDIGPRHQRLGQQGAPFHAGGEGGELGFGRQLHPGDDQVDLAVDFPAVFGVQLLPQAVQAGQKPGVVSPRCSASMALA